jgi:aminoglycoside phosphotransferase (APT) family kinase protein
MAPALRRARAQGRRTLTPVSRPEPVQPAADWSHEELKRWLAARFGLQTPALARVSSGNSRQIWIATDAARPSGQAGLLVRTEFRPGLSASYSLAREAAVYAALNAIGARVAALRGTSDDGTVLVTDVLPGETSLRNLSPEDRTSILRDFLSCIGAVHAAGLPAYTRDGRLFGRPVPRDLAGCVAEELAIWEAAMRDAGGTVSPLLELGLRWLRENVPRPAGDLALVQGDAGPGNFLHEAGAVTGVIDWEFAHPGDPLEDMAWIIMRSVLDRIPGITSLVEEHCTAQLIDFSADRLGYFLALVLWKVMVIRHRMTGDLTLNVGRNLYYRLAHQRMFVEVMARNLGVPEPDAGPLPSMPAERGWLYDYAVGQVKGALPGLSDESQRASLAGVVRVLRYLKAWDAGADWILGAQSHQPADDLARDIRAGRLTCAEAFGIVGPCVVRESAVCADFTVVGDPMENRIWKA